MNLYKIMASRDYWVTEDDIERAIFRWKKHVAMVDDIPIDDVSGPDSVMFVCTEEALLTVDASAEVVNNLRLELGHAKTERNNRTADLDKAQRHVSQLLGIRLEIRDALGVKCEQSDSPGDVDQKIMAELVTLKAMADGYATYVEGKAGTANHNAEKMARLAHRNAVLEREIKIANDKLDAKEGTTLP